MPAVQDNYLKVGLKILVGALAATAITFVLSGLGNNVVPNWTGREATGSQALGQQLWVFLAAYALGLISLRAVLRSRGKLVLYLIGGALVGLIAGALALLLDRSQDAFLPFALAASAIAGAVGAIPVSGSGRVGPAPVTPVTNGGGV